MYIVWAILGFSLIIIVHELGHFALAKINGIKVEEFSIGMGPKLYSYKGKETTYSIGILPIGGYVKMLGEEEVSDDESSFSSKPAWRRLTVILAGAIMNLILALIIFVAHSNHFGFYTTVINNVEKGTPAQEVGLQQGDKIIEIDGSKVFTTDDVIVGINMKKGEAIDLTIDRAGEIKNFNVKPVLDDKVYRVGFGFQSIKNPSFIESVNQSFKTTGSLIGQTFKGLKMMVTGEANFKTDVGGPVTIIKMTAKAAENGAWNLLYLIAFLSVNIGVLNLMPFPALDGGWSIILLIEMITGRKVPDKITNTINTIGFILLMGFMLLVVIKDIIWPIAL